ncbi:beta-aspartyl-peptidase [Proteiniborus sp. MB09-C3]|uniref:beta-aspartyl-peptidase n=1 Tax=Proteiniborus sp. MB09-C3 TaxID=3050072 RepID=UPI00255713ED|nr:beta-aspartyl-peptidase [Proteiniborus sp. MB09-C3]WIV13417.1 beta-aspartyl-peptidase [Proteiniborus sp. MB09-C3]
MLKLIKNGEIYSPKYLGKKDILLTGDKIGYIDDCINIPDDFLDIQIIDAAESLVTPGFIDGHVHITGGGGEGGFKTRTPEIQLSDITKGGVTTVIGVLGTDGTTRTMSNLLAKAYALEEEGISCYVLTGSYQVPVRTVTGSIQDDIILIDKIIGVGEVALSDHRSSQPTMEDIAKIAAEARVGGILSGKAGIVNIHMGDGHRNISFIQEIIEKTEIPPRQFVLTHILRNPELFKISIDYARSGGLVDFTTSTAGSSDEKELTPGKALKVMLEEGVNIENITFTSDGQGSLPIFDEQKRYVGLGVGKVTSLYTAVREAILSEKVAIEDALRVITLNPANNYMLKSKGSIEVGKDADIVLLNKEDLNINTVMAKGKVMYQNGEVRVKGTFE